MKVSTAVTKKIDKKILKQTLSDALVIAIKAGDFLRSKYGKFSQLDHKPDAGLVTEADKGSEALIKKALLLKYPSFDWLGEETGAQSQHKSDFRWVVDPLDGTTNFVHGFPFFCVSIGLEYQGIPVAGVVHNPMSRDTYWGSLGSGAFCNDHSIKVSQTKKIEDAMLSTGFSYKPSHHKSELAVFGKIIQSCRAVRRTGSAALDLCVLASGKFDGFFERNLSPWDVTAGIAILHEAGGQVSNYAGKNYSLSDETIVASNGKIHRVLIQTISE